MNDLEFKKQKLDPKSASFCAAKWYNATIWLGSGQTTSCHHPLPHAIDLEEIKTNPSAIHNTKQKKEQRRQMQNGQRPAGCEYCWKIEDIGRDAISDRVYKSKIYSDTALDEAYISHYKTDFNLKTLEIAFDRTCQFACSYCNPAFSTTWANDIKYKGPYTGLQSDGRNHFTHAHNSAEPYKKDETNPYVEAFYKWWETDLHKSLDELRITGGEPMMSPNLWRLLDWIETQSDKMNPNMILAINSNLCANDKIMEKFKNKLKNFKRFELYTSNEATSQQAEYIRDGLSYIEWYKNMIDFMIHKVPRQVHNMCTINALCLESLAEFLETMVYFKDCTNRVYKTPLSFTLNILRFPSFQSPLVLPDDLRNKFKGDIEKFLNKNKKWLEEMEVNHTQRLIDYLDVVKTPHAGAAEQSKLQKDFKAFYSQYDKRRGKDFEKTFPIIGEWYRGI
jgi:organic radical activating enzyme